MEDEKNEKEGVSDKQVTLEDVAKCAELMELISSDYSQVFDWPEELRVAFMTAAGKVSRPQREEFRQAKKDWQKAQRRKEQERDKHARKETGIRKAREATIFEAPKLLTAAQLTDERPELSTPRNCY
ncbi:MAG: oxidoreductase, partial [Rickettsiales bacterium]|nr:oxidoreductase [Rickettsiales bacterium]